MGVVSLSWVNDYCFSAAMLQALARTVAASSELSCHVVVAVWTTRRASRRNGHCFDRSTGRLFGAPARARDEQIISLVSKDATVHAVDK
jgi:hypothetical protein